MLEGVSLECIRNDAVLFSGVSFALAPGEILHVSGPNGSGKTSLLRILCGLGLPERGEVRWRGAEIRSVFVDFVSRVQYVGHSDGISLDLTCAENLEFACALAAADPGRPLGEALDEAGLGHCSSVSARRLSAGQRRRLALARLLLIPADCWLLDEPFTALDPDGHALVNGFVRRHAAGGGTAVISSHEPVEAGGVPIRELVL
ncbi:MAG: cytochrome c biogenesis heme-transporting ATPase CcmA [Gammaproteobacteria bacterium]|nr:cytochrome c biogenesis heme-transporting ATPase CcmA [Gammaproteobacteria bacterium]